MAPTLDIEQQIEQNVNPRAFIRNVPVTGEPADAAASLRFLIRNPESTSANLMALNGALTGAGLLTRMTAAEHADLNALQQASYRIGKRAFDILFAGCALCALSPVLLVTAAAIRLESKGPVLFRQRRLGQGGKLFSIIKFRTMVPDAEAVLRGVLASDPNAREEWEKDRKLRNDPRITGLGRFLRRSSLDELPQFWNVLIGEMSVVGPRPIVNAEIPFYKKAYRAYCAVRPGITGLWQVSGRNDTGYAQRVALDCKYVSSWSALLDLSIVCKTVQTVLGAAGAY